MMGRVAPVVSFAPESDRIQSAFPGNGRGGKALQRIKLHLYLRCI